MKWVSNLFTATSALFSASAAKRADLSGGAIARSTGALGFRLRRRHSRTSWPPKRAAFRHLALYQSGAPSAPL